MTKVSWPNRVTIIRILLIGPFVIALLNLQDPYWGEIARWSALVIFGLMVVSDGLDGYLARRLGEESAVGLFLDPFADKILILFSVVLLAHEGTHVSGALLPSTVVVIAVGKDLLVVFGFCIIFFTTSQICIEPQRFGKWCTTVQMAMVVAILLFPSFPEPIAFLPKILWWLASVLAIAALVQYFQLGRHLIAQHEMAMAEDQNQ